MQMKGLVWLLQIEVKESQSERLFEQLDEDNTG